MTTEPERIGPGICDGCGRENVELRAFNAPQVASGIAMCLDCVPLAPEVPADPACAICGQLHGLTMADLVEQDPGLPVYCAACEARLCETHARLDCAACSHAPQGETVKLFEPAPAQLPGQLGF